MRKEFNCQVCTKNFTRAPWEIRQGRVRFCSKICGDKNRKNGKTIACVLCEKSFYVENARLRRGAARYCSRKCSMTHMRAQNSTPNVSKVCLNCEQVFEVHACRNESAKFCNLTCKGTYEMTGERSHNWKGGITPESRKIRTSKAYRDFRIKVMERDDYTCQTCGVRGGNLEVDHIKPFAYYPTLRTETNNGQTLCKPCHKETPTWGYNVHSWVRKQYESRGLIKTATDTWTLM